MLRIVVCWLSYSYSAEVAPDNIRAPARNTANPNGEPTSRAQKRAGVVHGEIPVVRCRSASCPLGALVSNLDARDQKPASSYRLGLFAPRGFSCTPVFPLPSVTKTHAVAHLPQQPNPKTELKKNGGARRRTLKSKGHAQGNALGGWRKQRQQHDLGLAGGSLSGEGSPAAATVRVAHRTCPQGRPPGAAP